MVVACHPRGLIMSGLGCAIWLRLLQPFPPPPLFLAFGYFHNFQVFLLFLIWPLKRFIPVFYLLLLLPLFFLSSSLAWWLAIFLLKVWKVIGLLSGIVFWPLVAHCFESCWSSKLLKILGLYWSWCFYFLSQAGDPYRSLFFILPSCEESVDPLTHFAFFHFGCWFCC